MKKGIGPCIVLSLVSACVACHAARVDLSTYTDLSDSIGDSTALIQAIADAGDGGMVYIPAGTVVLDASVNITNLSMNITGGGAAVVELLSSFDTGTTNTPALGFVSTVGNTGGCRWSVKNVKFKAGRAAQGGAIRIQDEAGVAGNSRMMIRGVDVNSGITTYFNYGIEIDGVAAVEIELGGFVGELRDNVGEEPGHLTDSHVRLAGVPSGRISMYLCHLRRTQKNIALRADYGSFSLHRVSMVQCDHGVYQDPAVEGGRFSMFECASQIGAPLTVSASNQVAIVTSRFALIDDEEQEIPFPPMELTSQSAVQLVGNFSKKGGVFEDCRNVLFFGNHLGDTNDVFSLDNCSNVRGCNNLVGAKSYYYPGMYEVSGNSSNVWITGKEVIQ